MNPAVAGHFLRLRSVENQLCVVPQVCVFEVITSLQAPMAHTWDDMTPADAKKNQDGAILSQVRAAMLLSFHKRSRAHTWGTKLHRLAKNQTAKLRQVAYFHSLLWAAQRPMWRAG